MPKTTFALETPLREQLDRLANFEPTELPVISLYLDMQPDQNGRPKFDTYLRKWFSDHASSFRSASPERESFDRDVERITEYLSGDVHRGASGLAIFACHGASLFEAIPMNAPVDEHWLFIGAVPHLYPLARLNDQYPRYAAVLADTNSARIFVFGLGAVETQEQVSNVKTRRSSMGGWSQARYQRRVENFHQHHIKEVIDVLDRVVRDEAITQIVLSCDEVARPLFMAHLPKHLSEKLVDTVRMDIRSPEDTVLEETLQALRAKDAQTDKEHVDQMIGAWRARGLAVVGQKATLLALEMGQVEELLIAARPDALRATPAGTDTPAPTSVETSATDAADADVDPARLQVADDLVTKAQATAARIRFIEDPELLREVGGVGALLRFRI
jgi:peptide subunit release factor 1 (eRF1)